MPWVREAAQTRKDQFNQLVLPLSIPILNPITLQIDALKT
jgi:hypothetical protein